MKLFQKIMMIIGFLSVLAVSGYFIWNFLYTTGESKEKNAGVTVDQLLEQSVDSEEITTNFTDKGFLRAKFKIITTSQNNAEEVAKLQFLIKSTIIKNINSMKKADAAGPDGINLIENNVKNDLNKQLRKKIVTRVYLVDYLTQ